MRTDAKENILWVVPNRGGVINDALVTNDGSSNFVGWGFCPAIGSSSALLGVFDAQGQESLKCYGEKAMKAVVSLWIARTIWSWLVLVMVIWEENT